MSPLVASGVLIANILALALSLSVLMLALSQYSGDNTSRAVVQFLAALAFYSFSIVLTMMTLVLQSPPAIVNITTIIEVDGFALCTLGSFALVVSLAGMMKQAFQVGARAGMIAFLLIQWPLWNNQFFISDPVQSNPLAVYTTAGFVAVMADMFFIVATLIVAWSYRKHLEPDIALGIGLLMLGQITTLLNPFLREVGVSSLASIVAIGILGYRLVRMQLFNPLMMQKTQLDALRDVSKALIGTQGLQEVLTVVVQQSRRLLHTDLALIFIRGEDKQHESILVVGAQDGGAQDLIGRELPIGEGLSGHVYLRREALRVRNYQLWEGQSSAFADVSVYASISVPLLYDEDVVGVLSVNALKLGRVFSERDQAMLEMLAPQAAVAIVNTRLRQRITLLQQNRQGT